jgi:hypothetical protein
VCEVSPCPPGDGKCARTGAHAAPHPCGDCCDEPAQALALWTRLRAQGMSSTRGQGSVCHRRDLQRDLRAASVGLGPRLPVRVGPTGRLGVAVRSRSTFVQVPDGESRWRLLGVKHLRQGWGLKRGGNARIKRPSADETNTRHADAYAGAGTNRHVATLAAMNFDSACKQGGWVDEAVRRVTPRGRGECRGRRTSSSISDWSQ